MVNHTIVHLTYAVSPLCLPYDFIEQAASASVFPPALFLAQKTFSLQISDGPFDCADRQMQLSGNGTDCRIAGSAFIGTALQIQIHRNGSMWQIRLINFSFAHLSS